MDGYYGSNDVTYNTLIKKHVSVASSSTSSVGHVQIKAGSPEGGGKNQVWSSWVQ